MYTDFLESYKKPNIFVLPNSPYLNVIINSDTILGKVLDLDYVKVIYHPSLGKFLSVKSMWFWLKDPIKDDKLRKIVGSKLVNYMRDKEYNLENVPNFRKYIAEATWIKLKSYPDLVERLLLLSDTTPILSCYKPKGSNVCVSTYYASVLVPIIYDIIRQLKEGKEPVF